MNEQQMPQMKIIKPILKNVSIDNNVKKMPFGHDMRFASTSYDIEQAACITPKWLPQHSSVDRYKNANKGFYRSNDWFQIPLSGIFYIYERETNDDYYTVFESSLINKSQGDTPLWIAEWVGDKIEIRAINYYNGSQWVYHKQSTLA